MLLTDALYQGLGAMKSQYAEDEYKDPVAFRSDKHLSCKITIQW